MKTKVLSFFSFIVVLFFFDSCKHEIDLANAPEITFSKDVQPIITSRCSMSGCHSESNYEKFALITYEDVVDIVEPGNARSSELYEVITDLSGEDRMPPLPDNRLADQQILKIMVWIEQGAKNN
ncbi:MAG: hypothetical protein RI934_1241 [Bacteroidota bacterium]|jgi:hypothetical protein